MKFKFTTFLKIFGICFGSLIGVLGISLGVMKLVGAMDEPKIPPTQISFEFDTYNVDNDFEALITTTTPDVTQKDLTLTILTNGRVEERDNTITDGVITIPKTAKIGEKFKVTLNKVVNDSECDGLSWILGGHSEIRATSVDNPKCESTRAKINIDVPVYKIEIETRVSSSENDTDEFVVNSVVNANLKFYPQRSAYQFSNNGKNGYEKILKNSYYTVESLNDTRIQQQDRTNKFNAIDVGSSTIVGYCFKSTVVEQEIIKLQDGKSDDAKYEAIMAELKTGLTAEIKTSEKNTKTIQIKNVNVDTMTVSGDIKNVYLDTQKRIYANKILSLNSASSSLDIVLSSKSNPDVSLQSKLSNVGIRFLIIKDGEYVDCSQNEDDTLNIITLPSDSYSSKETYVGNVYYRPVITQNIDDYYWSFVVSKNYSDSIYIEIAYLNEEANITPFKLSFKLYDYASEPISWSLNESNKNLTIKILDDEQANNVVFKEFDLKQYTNVPSNNLYQTIKYFAYFDSTNYNDKAFEELIDCKPGVDYVIGSQTLKLYELNDGVIKAKTTLAHGLSFNCIFATVQSDYLGHIKYDENSKYIIDQYSKDKGILDSLDVNIQKTLKSFDSYMEFNGTKEDLDSMFVDDTQNNVKKFAFVQSLGESTNLFDIAITYKNVDDIEKEIFRQAIKNKDITIIAKLDGKEQGNTSTTSSNIPLLTFKELSLFEEDGVLKQKYSVYIGELTEKTETKIELFVRYKKSEDVVNDYIIECNFVKANNETIASEVADYIEIYDGEAQTFDFNLNLISPTSEDNRVVISSDIVATDGIVTDVQRSFKLNGVDVQEQLFVVTGEGDNKQVTSQVNIVMQDKYGRLPIKYSYKLESSDPNVMVVTGDTFTLISTDKDVNLILKKDGMQDKVLYIHAGKAGKVSKVEFIAESQDQSNFKSIWSSEVAYDGSGTDPYTFELKTISIFGAKGSEIKFNDTNVGAKNLVAYTYEYAEGVASLVPKTKVSLVEELDDNLSGYISIDDTKFVITRNFGTRVTIRLIASIPELGISQYINLDIKPNVTITLTQPSTQLPIINGDNDGPKSYFGLYGEYFYEFGVAINYSIIGDSTSNTDGLSYVFAVNDGNKTNILTKGTQVAKLQDDLSVPDIDTLTARREFVVQIYFDSFNDVQQKLTLTFGVNDNEKKLYDATSELYLYVTPNIKAQLTSDIIYLDTDNTPSGQVKITGKKDLYGNEIATVYQIELTRVIGSLAFANNVTFELQENVVGYEISNYTLKCIKQLTSVEEIGIVVKYNGCKITTLKVNVAPSIKMNNDNNDWVLYNGSYYLKLVNNKTYDFDTIKNMLTIDDTAEITNLEITENSYVSKTENAFIIQSVNSSLITKTDEDVRITIKITLNNGNSLTFNVMLFPIELPFVNYEFGDMSDIDLYNLLDVEWLKENNYYTSMKSTDENGVAFKYDATELATNYGIVDLDFVDYTLDDSNYALLLPNGNIKIIPAGEEKTIVIYANLNPLVSNSLIIPYVIKIQKELSLKVYYPYSNGLSDMQQVDKNLLRASSATFEREYLSVGENGKLVIDLLEQQEDFVPNKSQNDRRIAIYLGDNEYQGSSRGADIKFKVTKVLYTNVAGEMFMEAGDKDSFAYFSIGNNTAELNINIKSFKQLRIEIEITTEGLVGYYYISVGEIPTLIAYKLDDSNQTISDIEVKAGVKQQLNYALRQVITTSNNTTINKDVTILLRYYAISSKLRITTESDKYYLETDECTNNWQTTLVFYTLYGKLLDIVVSVQSNYIVTLDQSIIKDNSSIDKSNFNAFKYSNETLDYSTPTNIERIENIKLVNTEDLTKYLKVNADNIEIGAVDKELNVTFEISFNLGTDTEGQSIIYTNNYKFTIQPSLMVNKVDSQDISITNKLEITEVESQDNQNIITVNLVQLNSQIEKNSPFAYIGDDLLTWSSDKDGKFKATLVSELPLKNNYECVVTYDADKGLILTITAPVVVEKTIVTYRIDYCNNFDGEYIILSAYIVFTLNPNFVVKTNYPIPSVNVATPDDAQKEYFYINYDEVLMDSDVINLNETALLSDAKRIEITKVNSIDEYDKTNVFIQVNGYTDSTTIYAGDELISDTSKYYSFDTDFKFDMSIEIDNATFFVYLKIQNEYFEIGRYYVQLSKNIGDVWTVQKHNFNNNSQNDTNNPETIYLGSNDEINKTVKVNIEISCDLTDVAQKYYLEINNLFGVSVKHPIKSPISNGTSLFVTLYLESTTGLTEQRFNEAITDGFKIYDESDAEITDETITKAVSYKIISLTTRVELLYHGVKCDIDKLYTHTNISTLSLKTMTDNTKIKYGEIAIQSIPNNTLDVYYVQEILDVDFGVKDFDVSTGNKVNLIKESASSYENVSACLKRISNGDYYTINDLQQSDDKSVVVELQAIYSYDDEERQNEISNKGFLLVTPVASSDGTKNVDFVILAMGAPNEPVYVNVTFKISVGANSDEFTLKFKVSADYKNLSLLNTDGSQNSESNPCNIIALNDNYLQNYKTFARLSDINVGDNLIFIEHTNSIEGISGNIVPLFNVSPDRSYNENGYNKIYKGKSSDLIFYFEKVSFGNVKIKLIFEDNYGYTFDYYITLLAIYNPVYNSGTISFYEEDTVEVVNTDDNLTNIDKSNVLIPLKFESTNEQPIDTNNVTISSISFKYDDKLLIDSEFCTLNHLEFKVNSLEIFSQEISISGTLSITLEYEGVEVVMNIPSIVKSLYTIKTIDDVVYVRDGVPFDLLDVVEVVANKSSSIKIGEKSLGNSDSAKIEYEITNDSANYVIGKVTLGLRARNKVTDKILSDRALDILESNKGSLYSGLQDLFEISSVSDYTFQLIIWDSLGQLIEVKKDGNNIYLDASSSIDASIQFNEYQTDSNETVFLYSDLSSITINDTTYIKVTGGKSITLKFTFGQIIKDQILKIGLRDIANYPDKNITIYFTNNKTLTITCNKLENRSISLVQQGIIESGKYTSFLTKQLEYGNTEYYINKGMTQQDIQKLKDISITKNDSDASGITSDGTLYTLALSPFAEGESWSTASASGNDFVYQNKQVTLDVNYSKKNSDSSFVKVYSGFKSDIRVTLKFIGVDKRFAYGSNTVKFVSDYTTQSDDSKTITLSSWAGDNSSDTAFLLTAGYSNAIVYSTDDLYITNNIGSNSGNLSFGIHSTESSIDKYARIDGNGTITLQPEFDIDKNYLAIDIYVQNNADTKHLISTVQLAFRGLELASIEKNKDVLVVEDGQTTVADILKLFKAKDSNNTYWYGSDIKKYFGSKSIYFTDGSNTINIMATATNGLINVNSSPSIKIQYNDIILDGYSVMDYRYAPNSLVYTTDETSFNYSQQISDWNNDINKQNIVNALCNKIGFKDSYGDINTYTDSSISENLPDATTEFRYAFDCTSNSNNCYHDYQITYYYKEVTLGTANVRVWNTSSETKLDNITVTSNNYEYNVALRYQEESVDEDVKQTLQLLQDDNIKQVLKVVLKEDTNNIVNSYTFDNSNATLQVSFDGNGIAKFNFNIHVLCIDGTLCEITLLSLTLTKE